MLVSGPDSTTGERGEARATWNDEPADMSGFVVPVAPLDTPDPQPEPDPDPNPEPVPDGDALARIEAKLDRLSKHLGV